MINLEFSSRLVEMLIHSIWQGFLIAGLVAIANAAGRRRSAAARYAFSFAALLVMATCLPVTWMLVGDGPGTSEPVKTATPADSVKTPAGPGIESSSPAPPRQPGVPAGELIADHPTDSPSNLLSSDSAMARATPVIAWLYACGVLIMLIRLGLAFAGGERLRRTSLPVEDRTILECLEQAAGNLGLRLAPALAECERIAVPVIVGVFKPVILIPTSLMARLSPSQVEALLAHELAHLRRWDHLANLVQRIVESLLFYHPAAWYLSRCINRERENACDDLAITGGVEPARYAELLVRVSELSQADFRPMAAAALAATGPEATGLRRRVLRLIGRDDSRSPFRFTRSRAALGLVLAGLAITGLLTFGNGGRDDSLADFDFRDPPGGYEKKIRAADRDHRIRVGNLHFALSELKRDVNGTLHASLGLADDYEVVSFRLFDHDTRELIHDSLWQLGPAASPSNHRFRVERTGESARVEIEESGGELPDRIDLWLRLVENRPGTRIVIPAADGASATQGTSEIRIDSVLAGWMSGIGGPGGRMIWDLDSARDTDRATTVNLENRGGLLEGRYHLVAVIKSGWRHAMDHRHFVDFSRMGRHQYVQLDVAPDRIDRFELVPFQDRRKFFFNGVAIPPRLSIPEPPSPEENPPAEAETPATLTPQQAADENAAGEKLEPATFAILRERFADPDLRLARMYDAELNGGIPQEGGQSKAEHYYLAYLPRAEDSPERCHIYSQLGVLFSTNWHRDFGEEPDFPKAREYFAKALEEEPKRIGKATIRARLGALTADLPEAERQNRLLEHHRWLHSWNEESIRENWLPADYQAGREETHFPAFLKFLENVKNTVRTNLKIAAPVEVPGAAVKNDAANESGNGRNAVPPTFEYRYEDRTMQQIVRDLRRQFGIRLCFENLDFEQSDAITLGQALRELEADEAAGTLTEDEQGRLKTARRLRDEGRPETLLFDLGERFSGSIKTPALGLFFARLTGGTDYGWTRYGDTFVIRPRGESRLSFPVALENGGLTVGAAIDEILRQKPANSNIGRSTIVMGPVADPNYDPLPWLKSKLPPMGIQKMEALEALCMVAELAEPDCVWELAGYREARMLSFVAGPRKEE